MKYNKIETGEPFTLSDLLAKDNRVIIPDLQRDYCWGKNSGGKELVGDFINNIIENGYRKGDKLNLGLIYGYEAPVGHIQLCDGQQRITTLFLLLGLLNKKSENRFKDRLISDFEYKQDDREPYLQYSIRESSLYFLSDLVCRFFIEENKMKVSDIHNATWYFSDYDLDPSIQSMLGALTTIEKLIETEDAYKLGEYICSKLTFMYYDMEGRQNGEETFVIINTTGEPLSATENLKPRFVSSQANPKDASEKWEKWETWFWKYRAGTGKKENDTADNGFNEFFRWVTLLTTTQENIKQIQDTGNFSFDIYNIKQDEVDDYFDVVKFLFEDSKIFGNNQDWLAPDTKGNDQIVWFRLLPVIEYVRRYGRGNERNIIRVKKYFRNLARIDNVQKSIGDLLPQAIEMVKNLAPNDGDIARCVRNDKDISKMLLSDEERMKFGLYLDRPGYREAMEDRFWKAEGHPVWNGKIMPLLKWSTDESGFFDFSRFGQFDDLFCKLFHENEKNYPELDIVRRALLTISLKEYPMIFRGSTNFSFCWEYSDWQRLIGENVTKVGEMMVQLLRQDNPYVYMETEMIAKYPRGNDWADFVREPRLLEYCQEKNIQWGGDDIGWFLIALVRRTSYANLKSYKLYLELESVSWLDRNRWKLDFHPTDSTCAFLDDKQRNIAIDILHRGNDKYALELFSRKPESDDEERLKPYEIFDLQWDGNRYVRSDLDRAEALELLEKVCRHQLN